MKKYLIIFTLFLSVSCSTGKLQNVEVDKFQTTKIQNLVEEINPLEKIIEKLIIIETNGQNLVGDSGKAFGILQIHKIAVREYNQTYGTKYKHEDMFDEKISKEVCIGLLEKGIDIYKNKYKTEPSEQEIVRMWNGGIYTGYKKSSTIKYWNKYKNLEDENIS